MEECDLEELNRNLSGYVFGNSSFLIDYFFIIKK